jgi:uncharacterized membrane protein YfcA
VSVPPPLEILALVVAGIWAGGINTIVGSGSLVTFPVLLLFGYPPVTANVSNNLAMVPGGVTGIIGYRRELAPNRRLLPLFVPASAVGSIVGALLLLVLPAAAFSAIVPVLIALGLVMVLLGPAIQRAARRRAGRVVPDADAEVAPERAIAGPVTGILLIAGVLALGVYGGYFGAAQGILLTGLLAIGTELGLQRINAIKNVLATTANLAAAIVFLVVAWARIDWWVVLFIGVGAAIGGVIGARVGRRLPPNALRAIIVVIGLVALGKLLLFP